MSLLSQFYPSGEGLGYPAGLVDSIVGGWPTVFAYNGNLQLVGSGLRGTANGTVPQSWYGHSLPNAAPPNPILTFVGGEAYGNSSAIICKNCTVDKTAQIGQITTPFVTTITSAIKHFYGLNCSLSGGQQKPSQTINWTVEEVETINLSHIVGFSVNLTRGTSLVDTSSSFIGFCPQKGVSNDNPTISITGAALNAASVNKILIDAADSFPFGSGNPSAVDLSGGTSAGLADLTSDALAARTSLIARSCTVTLN